MLLVVFGYGPGTSHATAARFGSEGYSVALVGRSADRLADGVARLTDAGVAARAYTCDAGEPDRIREVIKRIRADHGPITTLLWTAYRNGAVQDVLAGAPEDVRDAFRVGVTGLLTAVQACAPDLRASDHAAVLVANGALGEASSDADQMAVTYGIDGTALEDAAKSKLVGILAERLRGDGVYVGELVVAGRIKGTARTEPASPTAIDPGHLADSFWEMATTRDATRRRVTETLA